MTLYDCKPLPGPAPCLPSSVSHDCRDCERRIEVMPWGSNVVVIDASVITWPDGVCPMQTARVLEAA